MFSVSITYHSKIRELSDRNNDPKLIQTNAHPWDPHDLDDENRKLSDITQNSSHPTSSKLSPPNPLDLAKVFFFFLDKDNKGTRTSTFKNYNTIILHNFKFKFKFKSSQCRITKMRKDFIKI